MNAPLNFEATHVDPVLQEIWAIKDAAATKFKTVANYAAYLNEKYPKPTKLKIAKTASRMENNHD